MGGRLWDVGGFTLVVGLMVVLIGVVLCWIVAERKVHSNLEAIRAHRTMMMELKSIINEN